jgi:hypothetical protein
MEMAYETAHRAENRCFDGEEKVSHKQPFIRQAKEHVLRGRVAASGCSKSAPHTTGELFCKQFAECARMLTWLARPTSVMLLRES